MFKIEATVESSEVGLVVPVKHIWNAWRYPSASEISCGQASHDMIWIGASFKKSEAIEMLPRDEKYLEFFKIRG